ncbi:CHAD domain-containing protein [Synechococcus sp. CS-603]|uniref:CHAD domain-containing protein n=1 Tax=Synechococcus sp. CS-603 TaxID=2847981 RepID=UPI00223A8729|nr:CHAD domain-containing protein [Synechococcus sp. CS-603]MCT0201817.1 CHAD domain-containing protein [Synechococcus sp. CS-603]
MADLTSTDLTRADLCSGAYAAGLIQRQTRRLGHLQAEVLADQDPESLHQLRVTLRRLRTALGLFDAALVLPEAVRDRRIAKVARHTGLSRDLDVMRGQLCSTWLPQLPGKEQKALKPLLRQLSRDRKRAFAGLAHTLRGAPYLALLSKLQKWQRSPRFTPIGQRPLRSWLFEWQTRACAYLFLQGGWFAVDPSDNALHDLRKCLKGVRYSLEYLEPFGHAVLSDWIRDLSKAQDCLGDLHDLQVLEAALGDYLGRDRRRTLPALQQLIELQKAQRWGQWLSQAEHLLADDSRRALQASLLAPESPASAPMASDLSQAPSGHAVRSDPHR